jgi:hypothetical protein
MGKNCSVANKPVSVLQQQLVFCYCIKNSDCNAGKNGVLVLFNVIIFTFCGKF